MMKSCFSVSVLPVFVLFPCQFPLSAFNGILEANPSLLNYPGTKDTVEGLLEVVLP